MSDITNIPTDVLLNDLEETKKDILVCLAATAVNIREHNGMKVSDRFVKNIEIRDIIYAELRRRGVSSET